MEGFVRIELAHRELLPGLDGQELAHECEALRLHLFFVTDHHQLLGAEGNGQHRGQVDLRGLVNDHDIEESGLTREEPGRVVRGQDPDGEDIQESLGLSQVLLHAVEH